MKLWIFGFLVLVYALTGENLYCFLIFYQFSADPPHRTNRATPDEIGKWVERTSLVARVMNGIALQAGLMKKQITVDEAVAELLNFGSVRFYQLSRIHVDEFTALTSLLKSFQGSLAATKEVLAIEEWTLVLSDILKESESIRNITAIPRLEEYFNSLETRKRLPSIASDDKKLADVLKLLEKVSNISDYAAKKPSEKAEDYATLCKILEEGKQLQEYISRTIAAVKDLKQWKVFADANSIFQLISTAIKLMKLRREVKPYSLTRKNIYYVAKPMNAISNGSAKAEEATWKLKMLRTIVEGRLYSEKQRREVANGLPKGIFDLEKLESDLKNPWWNQTFRSYGDLSKLRRALQPIIESLIEIKSFEGPLKSVSTQEMRYSLKTIENLLERLATLSATPTDVAELLDEFSDCDSSPIDENVYLEVDEVLKNTEQLARSFHNIREVDLAGLESDLKILNEFIVRITFVETTMDHSKNAELIGEIQKGDKWNVTALVKGIQMKYEPLRNQKFEEIARSLAWGKDKITDFQKDDELLEVLDSYECLRESANKSERVSNALHAFRILRSLDWKETDNVLKIASIIAKLSRGFRKLKDLPKRMRMSATAETKLLNKMSDSRKHAEILGKAANGLRNAHHLALMESSISLLERENKRVTDEISSVKDVVLKTHLRNIWSRHAFGIDSLKDQFGNVRDVESKLGLVNAKNLKRIGDSFKELLSLSSVGWDVESDLEVVKSLIPHATNKTKLEEVAAELEKFEALNLDFSEFREAFNETPSSLAALHTFVSGFLRTNIQNHSHKSASSGHYTTM